MNTNKETLRLYWQQIKQHKVSFFVMLISIPIAALLLDTLLPYFLTQAIGTFTTQNTELLYTFLITAGVVALIGVGLNLLGFQSAIHHESHVRDKLTRASLTSILDKDYAFFSGQKIGALTGKFIDFINAHVGLQDMMIVRTLTFTMNMTVGTVIILVHSWVLGLIVMGLIIALLTQVQISIKLRKPLRQARKELVGMVNGSVADTIGNNLTVKTFAHEQYELQQTAELTERYRRVYVKDFRWMSIEGSGRLLVMSVVQIIAISTIASLLFQGTIELGIAIFVVAYLQRIAAQLFSLAEIINGYDKLLLQAAPMTEILSSPADIVDAPDAKTLRVNRGEIVFSDITYSYNDAPETKVLDDLALTIPSGQRIGLVGTSGAGKTTLTKLLLRFDDVDEGGILIDGQPISAVTQQSLRSNIAYVPQEPLLFHRSLRENIAYGKLDATDEEIMKACRAANALDFMNQLQNGLDTVVGERGVKLSGGQRQRVAIARAILKDAPILILDEATSALDSESEKLIQSSLDTLMKGRTSIVIAHRLSTIAKLDRIIVLDGGKIVEDGSHAELLKKKGAYARLWSHQSGGFIEE